MWRNSFWMGALVVSVATLASGQEMPSNLEPACYGTGCMEGYGDCYGDCSEGYYGDCGSSCCGDGCDVGCCDMGCCDLGGGRRDDLGRLFFDYEATFQKFHQSGGVKSTSGAELTGLDSAAEFDFNFAPRYSAGYMGPGGFGIRVNYWNFSDGTATEDGLGFVEVDAETFDLEFFKRVPLGCASAAEVFAGARAAKFEQADDSDLDYEVDGIGLTVGLELSHTFAQRQRLYARTRFSIVQGDSELFDEGDLDDSDGIGIDNTISQIELAAGWEGRCCLACGTLVYGAGVEIQQWSDIVVTADTSDEAYLSDGAWGGFVATVGYEF